MNKNKQIRLNQTSKLLYSKGNHKEDGKSSLRMGEISCNEATDKGLMFKIHKQFRQLSIRKTIKKCSEDLNRQFSKKYIQSINT